MERSAGPLFLHAVYCGKRGATSVILWGCGAFRGANVKAHYIVCNNCGLRFGLVVGTGKINLESLPDPFHATCPHCQTKEAYAKSEVRETLVRSYR